MNDEYVETSPENCAFTIYSPLKPNRKIEQQAMKLNLLKNKNAQYQSHREFESKLIPKSLKLELEPTIRNHDQVFLRYVVFQPGRIFSYINERNCKVLSQSNK